MPTTLNYTLFVHLAMLLAILNNLNLVSHLSIPGFATTSQKPLFLALTSDIDIFHKFQVFRSPTLLAVPQSDRKSIIGVTLESNLAFDKHTSLVCRNAYFHIRALHHIRNAFTSDIAIHSSHVDYANSIFSGLSNANY